MFSLVLLCHRNTFVDNYNWHTTREKKTVQDLLRKSTLARIVLVSLGCFEKFSFSLGATLLRLFDLEIHQLTPTCTFILWNCCIFLLLHITGVGGLAVWLRSEQHVGQWVGWWIYQHGFFFHGAGAVKKWKKARKDALVIDCLVEQRNNLTGRSWPKEKLRRSISCTKFENNDTYFSVMTTLFQLISEHLWMDRNLQKVTLFKKNWQISTFVSEIAPKTKLQASGVVLVKQR